MAAASRNDNLGKPSTVVVDSNTLVGHDIVGQLANKVVAQLFLDSSSKALFKASHGSTLQFPNVKRRWRRLWTNMSINCRKQYYPSWLTGVSLEKESSVLPTMVNSKSESTTPQSVVGRVSVSPTDDDVLARNDSFDNKNLTTRCGVTCPWFCSLEETAWLDPCNGGWFSSSRLLAFGLSRLVRNMDWRVDRKQKTHSERSFLKSSSFLSWWYFSSLSRSSWCRAFFRILQQENRKCQLS